MKQALVATLVSRNRPGIVERVANIVAEHGADWLESHMVELAGQFAGIVHIEVPPDRHEALVAALEALGTEGLAVTLGEGRTHETEAAPTAERLSLELTGLDHPGIIRDLSAALAELGVSVDSLESDRISGSMSGEMLFVARAELALPEGLAIDRLEEVLQGVSAGLMVDVALDPVD